MDYTDLKKKLRGYIKKNLKPGRYRHSLRVSRFAGMLASYHGCSRLKAEAAGLAHDMARHWKKDQLLEFFHNEGIELDPGEKNAPFMLHGRAAACILEKDFYCSDRDILDAVRYHTTGRSGMGHLQQILFIADYLEPGRAQSTWKIRRGTKRKSLDTLTLEVLESMIAFQHKHNKDSHPWTLEYRKEMKKRG